MNADKLFTLRVTGQYRGEPGIIIHAFDAPNRYPGGTHGGIDIEVRQGGKVIFERGFLYCGVSFFAGHSIDGKAAKEAVLSAVAMKPGDTDPDYFDGYTEAQLEWARANGEYLSLVALERYGER